MMNKRCLCAGSAAVEQILVNRMNLGLLSIVFLMATDSAGLTRTQRVELLVAAAVDQPPSSHVEHVVSHLVGVMDTPAQAAFAGYTGY